MLKIFFAPISFLYFLISIIRNFLYNHNLLKSNYLNNITTITFGNLAVGGTGKTPHTEFLSSLLKSNYKVAVLSRGYKRKSKGFFYVNSEEKYSKFGDEPFQIKSKFKDITVAVSENRIKGIKKIVSDKKSDIVILDDAFQHRQLKPSLSILLTEYKRPFFKDYFFPLGRLRDNKTEYSRADIIIITKCPEDIKPIEKTIWRDDLKLLPYQKHFFTKIIYTEIINIFDPKNKKTQSNFKNFDILLITGIANPEYFTDHVRKNISDKIEIISFRDHKNFNEKNLQQIKEKFKKISSDNKIILTTEKDAIRLKSIITDDLKNFIFYQKIELEFLFGMQKEFEDSILEVVKNKSIS
ncbi:MAG: tetraacyldisaccharide 4'-kinase [Bacteroidales bacterium]|nr:tetraacyldisaccharide 4'-kinase [Bacteroidales bacterium]